MNKTKVYVGNLSYDVTSSDLNDAFSQYGAIKEVKLITDRDSGRSKGFAFVTFASDQAAESAVKSGNDVDLKGRKMKVNLARDDDRRTGGGGGGRPGGGQSRGGNGGGTGRW